MKAYLFPGQGSQRKGMGKSLFPNFSDYVNQADEVLGYSITELCLNDPDTSLAKTNYTQPAIFVVSALQYLSDWPSSESPDLLLGHSVGEYAALFAAGSLDFKTALKLVKRRGELMAEARGGGMAAVVGISLSELVDILNTSPYMGIEIANINSPDQIVIGAGQASLESFLGYYVASSFPGRIIPLKVSGAFHTRLMRKAQLEFSNYLESIEFLDPTIPVLSNVSSNLHNKDDLRKKLAEHLVSPVRWVESIERCIELGVNEYYEAGSKILLPMVEKIKANYEKNGPSSPYNPTMSYVSATTQTEKINSKTNKYTGQGLFHSFKSRLIASGKNSNSANENIVSELVGSGYLAFLNILGMSNRDISETLKGLNEQGLQGRFGLCLDEEWVNSENMESIINLTLDYEIKYLELQETVVFHDEIKKIKNNNQDKNNKTNLSNNACYIILRSSDIALIKAALEIRDESGRSLIDAISIDSQTKLNISSYEISNVIREYISDNNIEFQSGKLFIGYSDKENFLEKEVPDYMVTDSLLTLSDESSLSNQTKRKFRKLLQENSNSKRELFAQYIDWKDPSLQKSGEGLVLDEPLYNEFQHCADLFLENKVFHQYLSKNELNNNLISQDFLSSIQGLCPWEYRAAVYKHINEQFKGVVIPLTISDEVKSLVLDGFDNWKATSIANSLTHHFNL